MVNIVYSHSNCKDVLKIFRSQHTKHCNLPLHIISDYEGEYIYNDDDPYYKHWVNHLPQIPDDYFIYNQEDFILYNDVDIDKLLYLQKVLELNPRYSFVRLIKSGINLSNQEIGPNLYEVGLKSFPLYSMQATLWKKDKFIKLYETTKQEKWFESEVYEKACFNLPIEGLYYYDNEPKRGGNHYDSSIYPYIATAVIKGKWNFKEYKKELQPLLIKNKINPTLRGIF